MKVDKAKNDVDMMKDEVLREKKMVDDRSLELRRVREDYDHLRRNYDFLDNIDEIEKMQIVRDNTFNNTSII